MIVLYERPPLWEEIDKKFSVANKPVVFSWGDRLYNPLGGYLQPWLLAHEAFHGSRQKDPEVWWRQYLTDDRFRLNEELPAHRIEYQEFCRHQLDRNVRSRFFHETARRLASDLYGNLISPSQALRALR